MPNHNTNLLEYDYGLYTIFIHTSDKLSIYSKQAFLNQLLANITKLTLMHQEMTKKSQF